MCYLLYLDNSPRQTTCRHGCIKKSIFLMLSLSGARLQQKRLQKGHHYYFSAKSVEVLHRCRLTVVLVARSTPNSRKGANGPRGRQIAKRTVSSHNGTEPSGGRHLDWRPPNSQAAPEWLGRRPASKRGTNNHLDAKWPGRRLAAQRVRKSKKGVKSQHGAE